MDALKQEYARILQGLQIDRFNLDQDKYSGVFLPDPFEEYWTAKTKVMLVGRETAGWNTKPGKNTIKRAAGLGSVSVSDVVDESLARYRSHFELKGDKVVETSRSRFMQYYFRLARELGLDPRALIYANLFAWDYDKKSPRNRPATEFDEIVSASQQLLAAQIRRFKPNFIVFASSIKGADEAIRSLFNDHFGGYLTAKDKLVPGKLWEFEAAGATCYRIAHPRAEYGHAEFRDQLIERIKASVASKALA
ncbi:MAG: hypothetical protein CMK91_01085 [Pseudomonas sp.]|nr:hypothetical protein [Pseudomonas sp.]|tara:strand:+ start:18750 stop:19499 length:750 start_codon:yes stop_codon:yes gene_type:complete